MLNFKVTAYLKLIFIVSFISIFSAYYIEYILGYQPCNLCLIERIPYGLSMILIIINFLTKQSEKNFILLLILVFVFSFLISFYHFGIEQGYFEESTICGLKNAADIISKEELLKQLNQKIISCKDVTFKIFGISLTGVNMILSIIIIIILTKIFIKYEKIK